MTCKKKKHSPPSDRIKSKIKFFATFTCLPCYRGILATTLASEFITDLIHRTSYVAQAWQTASDAGWRKIETCRRKGF